jgi:hypothetical protein
MVCQAPPASPALPVIIVTMISKEHDRCDDGHFPAGGWAPPASPGVITVKRWK